MRNVETMEKERSPKLAIPSLLLAGSAVKSCRTVSISLPVYWVVLSHWEKQRN
ncbi:MAG: hypothetical protein H7Y18_15805 [Clostridiaceae bacterium]|nr:hypothetical protein [Clostridiaceae bacterium]